MITRILFRCLLFCQSRFSVFLGFYTGICDDIIKKIHFEDKKICLKHFGTWPELRRCMDMTIHELKYSNTNTYLIEGDSGMLLFDTGWAGSFPAFCKAMGEQGIPAQEIRYILISHFHPDHMGIAQEIADQGAVILAPELQKPYIHSADSIFEKEKREGFVPIRDEKVRFFPIDEGRGILKGIGIDGGILHTPGHSDDSISLCLDEGAVFVGDLNPLYELELHKGTEIERSWNLLLGLHPKTVYYGHAKSAALDGDGNLAAGDRNYRNQQPLSMQDSDTFALVSQIMKLVDKGCRPEKIRKKTGADAVFIEDVTRMYLTHRNVGAQGILDRIEIKNR